MKITKTELRKIIEEELTALSEENFKEIELDTGEKVKVPLLPGETTSSPNFKKRLKSMMRDLASAERPVTRRDAIKYMYPHIEDEYDEEERDDAYERAEDTTFDIMRARQGIMRSRAKAPKERYHDRVQQRVKRGGEARPIFREVKITRSKLKQIIQEEIGLCLAEQQIKEQSISPEILEKYLDLLCREEVQDLLVSILKSEPGTFKEQMALKLLEAFGDDVIKQMVALFRELANIPEIGEARRDLASFLASEQGREFVEMAREASAMLCRFKSLIPKIPGIPFDQ